MWRSWTNGETTPSHEANELACMLRNALSADADEPSDVQRRWSGLLVRIERAHQLDVVRERSVDQMWSGLLTRIDTPQRLNSMHMRSSDQMPCAWLLGWRMISLAHAVS